MNTENLERGIVPVMLQPFLDNGEVDWEGLDELVGFYLSNGASALFSACWSTEITALERSEILGIVQRTVGQVAGRIPIVGGAILNGRPVEEQAGFVRQVADAGADFVAITASMMVGEDEDEEALLARIGELLELTGSIPLAIYEAPTPYHRLLSPAALRRIAETGRFFFHKDTCCDAAKIRQKIEAIEGTPLRFYNAHSLTLLDSLRAGGSGYSGTGANFFPEIFVELCETFDCDPERAEEIQCFLEAVDPLIANDGYPQNAKMFLQYRNLGITSRVRLDRALSFSDARDLIHAVRLYDQFRTVGAKQPPRRELAGVE